MLHVDSIPCTWMQAGGQINLPIAPPACKHLSFLLIPAAFQLEIQWKQLCFLLLVFIFHVIVNLTCTIEHIPTSCTSIRHAVLFVAKRLLHVRVSVGICFPLMRFQNNSKMEINRNLAILCQIHLGLTF